MTGNSGQRPVTRSGSRNAAPIRLSALALAALIVSTVAVGGAGAAAAKRHSRGKPAAGRRRSRGKPAAGQRRLQARLAGVFGPYQEPTKYPSNWPPPFTIVYKWTSPVTTYSATIPQWDISNVSLVGFVRNPDGSAASAWFEYGTTRDKLDQTTERQNPAINPSGDPVTIHADVLHLRAKTRYFWRTAANFQQSDGSYATVYGTIGSFVTKPYPNLAGVADPCADMGAGTRQITEQLTLACTRRYTYTNDYKYSPIPTDVNYHGRVTCPRSDPRNLNAGSSDFSGTIPYINWTVVISFQHLVDYWRSNDSNRFVTVPGNNQNSAGSAEGPVPGWHNWDVAQWAYPFVATSTEVQFWINCTNNWTAGSGAELAKGEGNDLPSDVAPSAPQDFKAIKATDGGIDASWTPPASVSPSGIAGYFLTFRGWKKGAAKEIPENTAVSVTATGLEGHIFPAQIDGAKKASPSDWDFAVAVAAVSKEGVRGPAAVINWP